MPTRMIREGLLDSERYASVSNEARLFFVHLMLLADDFGCVSLSPAYLRRRCFYDSPTTERMARLISELSDADLIRTYEVDRHALAFIPRFGQRLYRATLKYAIPPEQLYADDSDALNKFNEIKNKTLKTPVVPRATPGTPPPEVELKLNRSRKETRRGARAPFVLPDWVPKEQWDAWLEARAKARKPATEFAKQLAVNRLSVLKEQGHHPAAVLAECALNNWAGIWPLKGTKNG